ncbi:terminase, partial [Escherichia coli]|nr:terminase [Escherichia coli]
KYYPPDTTAAIFWLKNRQKDKWRDKVDHELTGKDGGAIQIETSPMSTLFGK